MLARKLPSHSIEVNFTHKPDQKGNIFGVYLHYKLDGFCIQNLMHGTI